MKKFVVTYRPYEGTVDVFGTFDNLLAAREWMDADVKNSIIENGLEDNEIHRGKSPNYFVDIEDFATWDVCELLVP